MCAIYGLIVPKDITLTARTAALTELGIIAGLSRARGRDGQGYQVISSTWMTGERDFSSNRQFVTESLKMHRVADRFHDGFSLLGNCRAEPTTEWVKDKRPTDQQPYTLDGWTIVHNGTVANDRELRTNQHQTSIDSAAILERLVDLTEQAKRSNRGFGVATLNRVFREAVSSVKGSYALLAVHADQPRTVFAACNYKPLYVGKLNGCTYFASSDEYFNRSFSVRPIPPYSVAVITSDNFESAPLECYANSTLSPSRKCLVVLSGGMDSTVALAQALDDFQAVQAVHFQYGARPAIKELEACQAICEYYRIPLAVIPIGQSVYDANSSNLLNAKATIAGGEAGAEFAHEWVPARNLLMLANATAYAEAHGFTDICLGNNLEEAGAYPDNEPELFKRFDALLPFAVGADKRINIIQPVGNLMKHEIVRLGLHLHAPLHLTWSCYHSHKLHCGLCGPCYMRHKAFAINNQPEVIKYENEVN